MRADIGYTTMLPPKSHFPYLMEYVPPFLEFILLGSEIFLRGTNSLGLVGVPNASLTTQALT